MLPPVVAGKQIVINSNNKELQFVVSLPNWDFSKTSVYMSFDYIMTVDA